MCHKYNPVENIMIFNKQTNNDDQLLSIKRNNTSEASVLRIQF